MNPIARIRGAGGAGGGVSHGGGGDQEVGLPPPTTSLPPPTSSLPPPTSAHPGAPHPRYRPTRNYLDHLPPLNLTLFESDLMRTEFERLAGRQPMDTLSMKRCAATNPINKYFKQIPQVRAADAAAGEDDRRAGVDRVRGEQHGAARAPEDQVPVQVVSSLKALVRVLA